VPAGISEGGQGPRELMREPICESFEEFGGEVEFTSESFVNNKWSEFHSSSQVQARSSIRLAVWLS
jgi:hypothetical protein